MNWKQAEEAVEENLASSDADTEPIEEASDESPTANTSANGSAGVTPTSDLDHVAALIQDDPERARDILANYKRSLDGQHGTEISKLRAEMLQAQQLLTQQIQSMQTTPTPQSTEPDELGLTQAEYDQLDKVIRKTQSFQQAQQVTQQTQRQSLEQQARLVVENLRNEYGATLDKRTENRLLRAIRLANYDANNPDLVAEYNDIVEGLSDKASRTEGAVAKERKTRDQLSSRVNASSDRPRSQSSLRTDDIKIHDEKGRITEKSMMEAARQFRQRLDRQTRV